MASRPGCVGQVYINGTLSSAWVPLSSARYSGGKSLDSATIRQASQPVITGGISANVNEADVEIGFTPPGGSFFLAHWGRANLASVRVGDDNSLVVESRVEPYHFGAPLVGMMENDPNSDGSGSSGSVQNYADLVFNPMVDGQVIGNMSSQTDPSGYNYFLDPDSVRTSPAKTLQQATASNWTLMQAVTYLCYVLNASQACIQNPSDESVAELPTDSNLVRNVHIPNGVYLPEALDRLLDPLGWGWFLQLNGIGSRTIQFFQRGVGGASNPTLGEFGSTYSLDDNACNCAAADLVYDLAPDVNQIRVLGDWRYVEATMTLVPAWDNEDDSLTPWQLSKESSDYQDNPDYQRVWRDWVLNEAGDYIGFRSTITEPASLSTLFGHPCVPRRKKFLPCITLGQDLEPAGHVEGTCVEWSVDNGTTWRPLSELKDSTCRLLERECGVRFDGQQPPIELMMAGVAGTMSGGTSGDGTGALVRITATIRDDQRLYAVASRSGSSPQSATNEAVVDVGTRFAYRYRYPSGKFATATGEDWVTTNVVDDTSAIQDFANLLRAAWDLPDVRGTVEIEGLEQGLDGIGQAFEIGRLVTQISGRGIRLTSSLGATNGPQILGIGYDYQRQRRTLHIQTFRDPEPHREHRHRSRH